MIGKLRFCLPIADGGGDAIHNGATFEEQSQHGGVPHPRGDV